MTIKWVAASLTCLVGLISALVLVAWIFDITTITSVFPNLATMKFNTALLFIASSIAVWSVGLPNVGRVLPHNATLALIWGILIVSGLTGFEYLFHVNLGIDEWLIRDYDRSLTHPGRMSPATSICFFVFAVGMGLFRKYPRASSFSFLLVFSISTVAVLGYIYDVSALYRVQIFSTMAIHTTFAFLCLSGVMFVTRPHSSFNRLLIGTGAVSKLFRRLLLMTPIVLILIGWFRLWGERRGYFDSSVGVSVMVALSALAALGLIVIVSFTFHSVVQDVNRATEKLFDVNQLLEKKVAEEVEERSKAERLFRDLLEYAPDSKVIVNHDGEIVLTNAQTEHLFGYTRDQMLNRPVDILVADQFKKTIPDLLALSYEDSEGRARAADVEIMALNSDQQEFPVEVVFSPLKTESGLLVSWSIKDVSERHRLERELKAHMQHLEDVTTASPAVLYTLKLTDGGWVPSWISQNAEVTFGFNTNEMMAADWWINHVHQADRDSASQLRSGRSNHQSLTEEYRIHHKDGNLIWIRDEQRVLTKLDGTTQIVGAWLDITREKRLAERFLQAQKMEAVGKLAGGVAHDFNNLLTVIVGYAKLMVADLRESDANYEGTNAILDASERAAALTKQLLTFSRQGVVDPRVVQPNEIINETERMLLRLIGEDIKLILNLDPELYRVKLDAGQFSQVLVNLAVNARDAMPPGGGTITVETTNVSLDEEYCVLHPNCRPGHYVRLTFSDTGSGMAEDVKNQIFEPFFSTKRVGEGTGLGLATIYGVVQQSGGTIEVYSELGHGTVFKIYLPASFDKNQDRKPPIDETLVLNGTETILLVEDEESVRKLATSVLTQQNYRVILANNGREALETIADNHIDLLLTDVVMPEMGGSELAAEIRQLCPDIKVLFVSGYTDDVIVRNGLLAENEAFLSKPYTPTSLGKRVRELLDV